jgi:hypothetical protein
MTTNANAIPKASSLLAPFVEKLIKIGYLKEIKTFKDYNLDDNRLITVSEDRQTTHHQPILILGQCLPIDFQKLIKSVQFEVPRKRAGRRGSIIGNVYLNLTEYFEIALYGNKLLSPLLHNLNVFPVELISLISEYINGPVMLLEKMLKEIVLISPLFHHQIETFIIDVQEYNYNYYVEPKLEFRRPFLDTESPMAVTTATLFNKLLSEKVKFPILSFEKEDISVKAVAFAEMTAEQRHTAIASAMKIFYKDEEDDAYFMQRMCRLCECVIFGTE